MLEKQHTTKEDYQELEQFKRSFVAGSHYASQILPRMRAGMLTYQNTFEVLEHNLHGSSDQHIASYLLGLPDVLASAKNEPVDLTNVIKNHGALKEIMLDVQSPVISRQALVEATMRFARANILTTDGNDLRTLEMQIKKDIDGMWHEQSFSNLLCAGNLESEEATTSEDFSGIDFYVKQPGTTDSWLAFDVKASDGGIDRTMTKRGQTANYQTYISGQKSYVGRIGLEASRENPLLNIVVTDTRVFVHMDVADRSNQLAPVDFRGTAAAETVQGLASCIANLGRHTPRTFTHTILESGKSVFAPTKFVKAAGKTATIGAQNE